MAAYGSMVLSLSLQEAHRVLLGSAKGNVGHLNTAAGDALLSFFKPFFLDGFGFWGSETNFALPKFGSCGDFGDPDPDPSSWQKRWTIGSDTS